MATWELLLASLSEEVQELAAEHLEMAEIEAAYNALPAQIRNKAIFAGRLKKAVREAQARPGAAAVQPRGQFFSPQSQLSDPTAIQEMEASLKLQTVQNTHGGNADFTRFLARQRRVFQTFSYQLLACLSETDASRVRYYNSFADLLKHTHREFLAVPPGCYLVAAVDQFLGTAQPFRPDITWASAIQQVEIGPNDGWRLCKGMVEAKAHPLSARGETAAKRQLVTQAEAITTVRFQRERDWRKPLPALITDGRIVLGATIHPTEGGHTMLVTGRLALARPNGEVDAQSAGFLEVLHFVWVAERMELRAQAAAVYDSLPRKPSRLTTPSGSNVVSLGERLGIQTFACSLGGTKMIARVSLPEQLLQRATEAELHGFSQVDNELRLIQSGAKLPVSVQAVGSLTEANLPCVLWEFAGAPLPRELSLESLPVLLKDVTAALRLLQEQGWCHGDVTRDNIVMATSADGSTAFTLIDFGFTTKLGENIVCRTTNLRTGASSQLEDNLARSENDVESLMYVLMELVGFPLPWAAAASFGDKAAVVSERRQFIESSPQLLEVPPELATFFKQTCACLRGEKPVADLLQETSSRPIGQGTTRAVSTPQRPSGSAAPGRSTRMDRTPIEEERRAFYSPMKTAMKRQDR